MLLNYVMIFIAGIAGGFLNSTASSGSAIVLPMLLFLGLPASIANGTNRVSILLGSLVAVWNFNREGSIPWKNALLISTPTIIGTIIGSFIATLLDPKYIAWSILAAIICALLILLSNPTAIIKPAKNDGVKINWFTYIVFTVIGIWIGYIVLDSATWILIGLVRLAGFDLTEANGIKNFLLLISSIFSLIIFQSHHQINWYIALMLSAGSCMGAFIGSQIGAQKRFKLWIFRILVFAVVLEITILALDMLFTGHFAAYLGL